MTRTRKIRTALAVLGVTVTAFAGVSGVAAASGKASTHVSIVAQSDGSATSPSVTQQPMQRKAARGHRTPGG